MMSTLKQHVRISGNPGPIARRNINLDVRGEGRQRMVLAKLCNMARELWIVGSEAKTFSAAANQIGITPMVTMQSNESEYWRTEMYVCNLRGGMARRLIYDKTRGTEWIICPRMQNYDEESKMKTLKNTTSKLI
jgi:hypothetical protein